MTEDRNLIKTAVFASGNGSNLQVIIDQAKAGLLPIEVVAVISDYEDAYALERARKANLEAIFHDPALYTDREAYDVELKMIVDSFYVNLLVLAGFMRILTADFVSFFQNRILNIHPSLLPKFKGLNTHERVLAAGEKYHGATVHYVTAELDAGPIIEQKSFEVLPTDSAYDLQQKVHQCEYEIYPRAIQSVAERILRDIGQH